jgi:hypothetical protein
VNPIQTLLGPASVLTNFAGNKSCLRNGYTPALTHVPAPAKTSTNPIKIAASIVDRVQGVRIVDNSGYKPELPITMEYL